MPFSDVHYSSEREDWATPQAFFDRVNSAFGFTLDVCASSNNTKCERYYTTERSGLLHPWNGVVWCNPPYGRDIGLWVRRAAEQARGGATVCVLTFARTDTHWFQEYGSRADYVLFVKGRLKFGDGLNSAPAPSILLAFGPEAGRIKQLSGMGCLYERP